VASPVTARGYDLAIVGAGIVGLAHALAAVRLGKRVVVIDRDAQANGASIRNFGFITVTGQQAGDCWRRALRSRDVWVEIAPHAGVNIVQNGLLVVAKRPEAMAVLDAFHQTSMADGCELLGPAAARQRCPMLAAGQLSGALWSPRECRVESREAIPKLARWLEGAHGVTFIRHAQVSAVEPGLLETSVGTIEADACVVCPGDDFTGLFADRLAAYDLTRCKLQMLRIAAPEPDWHLPGAIMSDLGLVRYLGYAELPAAAALRARLETERADALANGVHLIVVQSADGSLVVGDSHHYAETPDPFAPEQVEQLILDELQEVLAIPAPLVTERWIGTYASAPGRLMLVDRPDDRIRIVVVTSGTGASTAFAIAEETLAELFGVTAC
jgi:FAD dependent oxidoreductase TIGR03364